ncbi:cell division cycle protein 123 homolog [Condylostylus longicornis]|uniref:cell division cycle protein 123 homolog n=1 Tax=Condylostylus longicornis TaxID=2530218 RepID=UPI00244DCDBF|nr:cell division cycle protein 123 homolog [Condylostylus longicornis]
MVKICNEMDTQSKLDICSFKSWYKKFEKITIPSICIHIPKDVLEYFRDELVILPKECYTSIVEEDSEWDNEINEDNTPEYPEFSNNIRNAIKELDGSVFLKTNWHCPKDAFWITAGQTLKVKDIIDAYQLIKASSIIKRDLNFWYLDNQNNQSTRDFYLILRKWMDIHPGTEFRCFVRNNKLIAISPRDWPQFHKHIIQQKHEIVNDILSLFKEKIQYQFPLDDYCFDVVRQRKDNVILLDFSTFEENFTDALAFDWEFLKSEEIIAEENEAGLPEFRYLNSDCGIQPHSRNNYAIPQDIIDMFNPQNSDTRSNLTDLLAARVQEEMELQNRES